MNKSLVILVFICLSTTVLSQELSLMTYNIRYATVNDGENQWEKRKDYLGEQLLFYAPDIFGIQEGLGHQVSYLDDSLSNYSFQFKIALVFYEKKSTDIYDDSVEFGYLGPGA